MAETAIAFAMKKAGVNTDAALLLGIATDELRKVDWDARRALEPFTAEVRDAGGIMAELHPFTDTRERAWVYLSRVVADRNGEGLKVPAKVGGGVQVPDESQNTSGPVEEKSGGGGVQLIGAGQTSPSPPSPLAEKSGEGGIHRTSERHEVGGPPSPVAEKVGEGDIHRDADSQLICSVTPPAAVPRKISVIPNKPRGLAEIQLQARVNSAYVCHDGQEVESIVFSSLPRLARERRAQAGVFSNEAKLFDAICSHAIPPPIGNVRVGDVIKTDELRKMVLRVGLDG